jgi:signal peptidase I
LSELTQDETTTRVDYEEVEEVPKGWLARQFEGFNTLFVAVLIALAIRAFVIEPFRIPSESMLPTLLIGDHLFVNKFVYGVKLPFTDARLPKLRDPQRGDVVVFTVARDGPAIFPADQRPDLRREEFVKRIVAVPGDTVEVSQSTVRVNGRVVSQTPLERPFDDGAGRTLRMRTEEMDGRAYTVLDDPLLPGLQQRPFRVPEGRYFMMGDNRDHSNDSRNWGTVELAQLKGPAFVLYWSWNWDGGWGELLNPLTWVRLLTQETRWSRIGNGID